MAARIYLVIPTAGTRLATLGELVESAGLPRSRVILVRTSDVDLSGFTCQVVDSPGDLNIQRWWNEGIRTAFAQGATHIATANDDIALDPDTLTLLQRALDETSASLATPGEFLNRYRKLPFWRRILNGALWMQRRSEPMLADEGFRWAYGDDDLDLRARLRGAGVVTVPVTFRHLHWQEATDANPELLQLSLQDARTFEKKYPIYARIYAANSVYVTARLGLRRRQSQA